MLQLVANIHKIFFSSKSFCLKFSQILKIFLLEIPQILKIFLPEIPQILKILPVQVLKNSSFAHTP